MIQFTIYKEDFSDLSWEDNCKTLGVSNYATEVTLYVEPNNVVQRL